MTARAWRSASRSMVNMLPTSTRPPSTAVTVCGALMYAQPDRSSHRQMPIPGLNADASAGVNSNYIGIDSFAVTTIYVDGFPPDVPAAGIWGVVLLMVVIMIVSAFVLRKRSA